MAVDQHREVVKDFLRLVRIDPPRPSVEALGELVRAFMRFPYENLTKIIRADEEGDPIRRMRMPEIVLGDHVDLGAGGTCFSLTYFFKQVLTRCGYPCQPVFCDRSYGPDTHCAIIAHIDGARYLVDPGYLLEHPVELPRIGSAGLDASLNRTTVTRLGETSQYILATNQGGRDVIRYRLKDVAVSEEEFRHRWIDSFAWAQMRHLCITRLERNGHIYLRDAHLKHSTPEKRSREKIERDFERVVQRTFGIDESIVLRARRITPHTLPPPSR